MAALLISCTPLASQTPLPVNQASQSTSEKAKSEGQVDNSTPGLNENATAAAQVSPELGKPVKKLSNADLQKLITGNPANIDNSKYEVTPVDELHTTGNPRQVDISEYRLVVDGLVDHPLSLSYEDLLKYPAVTETVLLICPDFFVDNAEWTGVPLEYPAAGCRHPIEGGQDSHHRDGLVQADAGSGRCGERRCFPGLQSGWRAVARRARLSAAPGGEGKLRKHLGQMGTACRG